MIVTSPISRWYVAGDDVVLHARCWPVSDPCAVLVFVHGIASHSGWFTETAEHLASHGIEVHAPDRRGSGQSGGARGHLSSVEQALRDLDLAVREARAAHPGVPVHLAPSSWAAKLGLWYVASRPAACDGLVLLGPGLFPTVALPVRHRVRVAITHAVKPLAPIPIPLAPEHYTTNPGALDFIRHDPLRLLTATAQFFWETRRLDRGRGVASASLVVPLLVLQGEADLMMSISRTRRWFDELTVQDKIYRAYPGARHTLDFEADPSVYLADLRSWLCRR